MWRYFPADHRELQRPRPTADPAIYLPRHHTPLRYMPNPPKVGMYPIVSSHEKTYRTARAGDLGAGIAQKLLFQKPSLHVFTDSR
jgi:hypothetical protein